jgi:hypothetical protein
MTKTLGTFIRMLSVAALLAAAALSLPAGAAHAKPKSPAQLNCEARGYWWFEGKGCADKSCSQPPGTPGDTRQTKTIKGNTFYWMCDGLTGTWERFAIVSDGVGPLASLPQLQQVAPTGVTVGVASPPSSGVAAQP